MDEIKVKFYNQGKWLDKANEPAFNVNRGEERWVSRDLANYICALKRGEIIDDPKAHIPIPDEPNIKDLELHPVTLKCLEKHGVLDLQTLCALTCSQILNIEGIGQAKLNEIETQLNKLNLKLLEPI